MMKIYYSVIELPTGRALAVMSDKGLMWLALRPPTVKRFVREVKSQYGAEPLMDDKKFAALKSELAKYFRGERVKFKIKLDVRGTEFQKKVWASLMKIPYGDVRSYKWIAEQIKNPKAARAVGGALGANPVPIVVPCHRVVNSGGGIGGYGAGVDIKKKLLEVEGELPGRKR